MKQSDSCISVPRGFRLSSHASGIKTDCKPDVAVLVADQNCVTHGAFTQNLVRASSVDWNETRIGLGRALVVNSGNANACTGQQGEEDTRQIATILAEQLGCPADHVMVMSTGIIGEPLPMDLIGLGIGTAYRNLDSNQASVEQFADGILTTDSFRKIVSRQFDVDGCTYNILGIAKGAGMIGPKMANPKTATLLGILLTDFPLASASLESQIAADTYRADCHSFQDIIGRTFNCISVDGHTSTSDQVMLFAPQHDSASPPKAENIFFHHLEELCEELAKKIPADGEGATHLISIEVRGKYADEQLHSVAKTIADSPLVKTAVFGADPNWGRIVSAAGYDGLPFCTEDLALWLNGHLLYENGTPVKFDEKEVSRSMKENFETEIRLDVSRSQEDEQLNIVRYWTSDLTYDYIKINAEYHT